MFGSLETLAQELERDWPEDAQEAEAAFRSAIADARRLALPVIVDF